MAFIVCFFLFFAFLPDKSTLSRIYLFILWLGIKKGWGANAKSLNYYDDLVVPIIENTNREQDLKVYMHPDRISIVLIQFLAFYMLSRW